MKQSDIDRIKNTLDQTHDWPAIFMFKFIVPSENQKIAKVESLFNSETASIKMTQSKNGKYTSITAKEVMTNADAVLKCYDEASQIEGLIAL